MKKLLLLATIPVLLTTILPSSLFAQSEGEGCDASVQEQRGAIDARVEYFDCEIPPESAPSSPGSGSVVLTGCDNTERIWNYFTDTRNLPDAVAAGFLGNMQEEAHFEPRLVEYGWPNSRGETSVAGEPSSLDDNVPPDVGPQGQPGYGIIQWTFPSRKQGLRDLAAARDSIAGDLALQLDYLWQELGSPPYAENTLGPLTADPNITPEAASEIITRNYEIPSNMEVAVVRRQGLASDFFTRFTTGGGCG